ncbi:serine hydrolase domain-containing protein [Flavilitoribacter nigricans]|uniref:Beta-lactamase-related domain-containing protein n=1 Tax=Flavilitoribacter nigricans (strain ATCC 23147 / DSM 23189 / NBRC 102662 / NCIMB 1420 / SS-2) TaxID=1122177 RepID=A0A2D0N681_FLAN2|nr:serine hydrolase domain-containing protein [Flavilitoribacter nigricans]PHN04004.1 hypothetical protein CRP01_24350 [Flavilitoribacter nigricans DSM 23189 = NBRC 102662]
MQIIRCTSLLIFYFFVGSLTNCISQQPEIVIPDRQELTDQRLTSVRDTILSWVDQGKIPSMSVGVLYQEKAIWLEGLGRADIQQNIPATPQTIYPLGSMSKSISATGVMTLVEQNRIELDSRVNELLAPGRLSAYRWDADQVKVWHILNCAAGIPHGWTSFNDPADYPHTDGEKDELLRHYGIITLPPGQFFNYSNYTFGVADLIMERVSGLSLQDYLQRELFTPLGMQHSYTTYFPQLEVPYAMTYHRDLTEAGRLNSVPYGGLGYYSSAEDLLHYAQFHLKEWPTEQSPLSPANIEQMHHFPRSVTRRFGLGWHDMGHALVSNGSVTGANTNLTLVPESDLAIVCLTNVTSFNGYADQIAQRIMDALLPDLEKQVTYEKYVAEYENPYVYNEQLAGNWRGTIRAYGEDLTIRLSFPKSGKVFVQIEDGAPQQIEEVIYNRHQLLNFQFTGKIPLPQYDGSTPNNNELILYPWEGKLVGHIAAAFSSEAGGFRYGVYVELDKE